MKPYRQEYLVRRLLSGVRHLSRLLLDLGCDTASICFLDPDGALTDPTELMHEAEGALVALHILRAVPLDLLWHPGVPDSLRQHAERMWRDPAATSDHFLVFADALGEVLRDLPPNRLRLGLVWLRQELQAQAARRARSSRPPALRLVVDTSPREPALPELGGVV